MNSHVETAETYQELIPIPGFVTLGQRLRAAAKVALLLGVLLLILGSFGSPDRMWGNLLLTGYNLTCVGLGGLFLLAIQALASGRWADTILAPLHAMPRVLPYAGAVMLLLWFGVQHIYPWARPEMLLHEPVIAGRAAWLNPPFFFGRVAIFFALWMLMGGVLLRKHHFAAPFMVIFGITFALASFDWVMSVQPLWYSTIFAIYGFAGMFVQSIALLTLSAVALHKLGLAPGLDKARNHDLGKMLFAFSCFWAYIWLSQFLLTWYANLPEETGPLHLMLGSPWTPLFYLNVVMNFGVPFFFLMRRDSKTDETTLVLVCLVLLAGHWLDLYLNIFPALTKGAGPSFGLCELGGVLLTLGLGHLGVWRRMTRTRPTLWQARYATGFELLDAQHQALLAQVNEIYGTLELPDPTEARNVERQFRKFTDMVRIHLQTEEAFMRSHGYPNVDRHATGHAAFLQGLEAVISKGQFGVEAQGEILDALAMFRQHFEAEDELALMNRLRKESGQPPVLNS